MAIPTTYDEAERDEQYGSPVELYRFDQGTTSWFRTSAETLANDYVGNTYSPYPISRGEIEQSQEDKTGALDVEVPQDDPIAQMFIGSVPVLPISLTIYRLHRTLGISDPLFQVVIFVGKVSAVTFSDGVAKISCLPVSAVLRKSIPWPVYQSQCNWALYGVQCGVDAAGFETVANVDGVYFNGLGHLVTFPEIVNVHPDWGYFVGGFARRTLNGDVKWIVAQQTDGIYLMSKFTNPPLEVGETLTVVAGCDRKHTTCLVKFNNLDNFMGMPFVPLKNPYTGSIA